MAKSPTSGFSLLRTALLGATALVLFNSVVAEARVGVTSATDGDPKGKPPSEAERVLRIGIDVQANEVITTSTNDRAHLVFLDGTSVTVGPNASLTIDKFVYDPSTKTGDLAITASKGVFRLVGGKISKTNPITVNTPSSTIGIRGGITMFTVSDGQTTSTFIFGDKMTVTSQGATQTATKPGFQVTTLAGTAPGAPVKAPPGSLSGAMSALEGSGGSGGGGGADSGAQSLGATNSNLGTSGGTPPPAGGGNTPNTTNALSNASNSSNPSTPPVTTPTIPRTTRTLNGYVGGLVNQTSAQGDVSQRYIATGNPGQVTIATNATTGVATATIVDGGSGGPPGTLVLFSLGGPGQSVFTNDKTYATGGTALTVFVPGNQPTLVAGQSALVSNGIAPDPTFAALGVTPCACDFLTWGQWTSTNIDYAAGGTYRPGQRDQFSNVSYVAGTLSSPGTLDALFNAANLPGANQQNFVATYNGHLKGTVQFGANTYQSAGIYQNVWSFGARSGVVTGQFDGLALSGTANLIGNSGPGFSGPITSPGLSSGNGFVNGAFFASPTDPVAGQAGNFGINGTRVPAVGGAPVNYQVGGTFAAQR